MMMYNISIIYPHIIYTIYSCTTPALTTAGQPWTRARAGRISGWRPATSPPERWISTIYLHTIPRVYLLYRVSYYYNVEYLQLGLLRLNPPGLGSKCSKQVKRLSDFGKYKGYIINHSTSLPAYRALSQVWGG